jgi:hypothetical protein
VCHKIYLKRERENVLKEKGQKTFIYCTRAIKRLCGPHGETFLGENFPRGTPYDVIIVTQKKQCFTIFYTFFAYYPALTQLGLTFSVKQSCIKTF